MEQDISENCHAKRYLAGWSKNLYRCWGEEEEEEWPANVTRIFPNPAMGIIYVLMSDPDTKYGIAMVSDSYGRFVFSRPVNFGLNPIEVPVSMPSGFYTVTLEAATLERFIRKMIIIN
jgi:hypothetical protein